MTRYDKLVRDKIPEIMQSRGERPHVIELDPARYARELDRKLAEETAEYQHDQNVEELADILEVVYAIADVKGVSRQELERVRAEKAAARGGFARRLYLIGKD